MHTVTSSEPPAQNHEPKGTVPPHVKHNFSIWFPMEAHLESGSSDVVIITLTGSKLLKRGIKMNMVDTQGLFHRLNTREKYSCFSNYDNIV